MLRQRAAPRMSAALAAGALAGCAATLPPAPPEPLRLSNAAFEHAERRGAVPYCDTDAEPTFVYTGAGGDVIIAGRGTHFRVFDVGDKAGGPTPDTHDQLVLHQTRPDQLGFDRVGEDLRICSEDRRLAVVIHRQYCGNGLTQSGWNNAIEEIVFSSGETWLDDSLFNARDPEAPAMTRERAELYRFSRMSDAEIAAWRVAPFSEKLPAHPAARSACLRGETALRRLGYVEAPK